MQEKAASGTKQKFRPRSLRLQSWNYAMSGWYHVTICTKNRFPYFGRIDDDGKMHLSRLGKIVEEEWLKTAEIRPNVELDEYSILPDHFHGILVIENDDATDIEDLAKKDHWQKECLGSIINQFKGACTKRIRKINPSFSWQRNFNDHIVRNERDLERIRQYIKTNPQKHAFRDEM